jgi:hypothetical protein
MDVTGPVAQSQTPYLIGSRPAYALSACDYRNGITLLSADCLRDCNRAYIFRSAYASASLCSISH